MYKTVVNVMCSVICIVGLSVGILGEPTEKPFNFSPGTNVSSSQVNTNFDVLYENVNELETSLTTLKAAQETAPPTFPEPDFDSGWFSLGISKTYSFSIGFSGLPRIITAYYKLENGQILMYGMNHYGDAGQDNGTILDFDENGTLYVRTGQDNAGHFGQFSSRSGTGVDVLYGSSGLQFRVLLTR